MKAFGGFERIQEIQMRDSDIDMDHQFSSVDISFRHTDRHLCSVFEVLPYLLADLLRARLS